MSRITYDTKTWHSFEDAVGELFGGRTPAVLPVSGGDINRAYRLESSGKKVFMKANRKENARFFAAEVAGLRAIADTNKIRVPEVLGTGTDDTWGAFLLLEWAEGKPGKAFHETFGHHLAAMHLADTAAFVHGGVFGFDADNFIGAGEPDRRKVGWSSSEHTACFRSSEGQSAGLTRTTASV